MTARQTSSAKSDATGVRLARDSAYNIAGLGIPLFAAVFVIPVLIRELGISRFGILTIEWMFIGYFSLFDLGLGRALNQAVASKLSANSEKDIPSLIWTTLTLMLLIGAACAIFITATAPYLISSVFSIPENLQDETLYAFMALATTVPIVMINAALIGVLAALQRFDVLNLIRAPLGIYSFLAPLLILPYSKNLFIITLALVFGRFFSCAAYMAICIKLLPALRSELKIEWPSVIPLMRFGAWMTVTNVVGPLLSYLDRLFIAGTLAVSAVSFYATPYDMVTKLWVVPGAVVGVLFSEFAKASAANDTQLSGIFLGGLKYLSLSIFPVCLLIVIYSNEGLTWWIGADFAKLGTPILQWLTIGVFISSVTLVFSGLIEALGKPALKAKLQLIELPIYIAALYWIVQKYGIVGVAVIWTARVAIEFFLLLWMSTYLIGGGLRFFLRISSGISLACALLVIPIFLAPNLVQKHEFLAAAILAFMLSGWYWVLCHEERRYFAGKCLSLLKPSRTDVGR